MIYIDDIPSFRDPETSEITFEQRVEKIELLQGVMVKDSGYIEDGTIISLECVFEKTAYEALKNLWAQKKRVTYTDEAGNQWGAMKLVIRKMKYDRRFKNYVWVTLELWSALDLEPDEMDAG